MELIGTPNNIIAVPFDFIDKIREIGKNTDLILANTQETLLRLQHVMTQMYELHEYTTPRYFFILPEKQHDWTLVNSAKNLLVNMGLTYEQH